MKKRAFAVAAIVAMGLGVIVRKARASNMSRGPCDERWDPRLADAMASESQAR